MPIKENPEHCLFCKIIRGELPSSKIYEDEQITIIVDLYPVNKGHVVGKAGDG